MIDARARLASIWLPWCVDALKPTQSVPADHPNASQLRLTDLELEPIREALKGQPYKGSVSWEKIDAIASEYREQASRGETVVIDRLVGATACSGPSATA